MSMLAIGSEQTRLHVNKSHIATSELCELASDPKSQTSDSAAAFKRDRAHQSIKQEQEFTVATSHAPSSLFRQTAVTASWNPSRLLVLRRTELGTCAINEQRSRQLQLRPLPTERAMINRCNESRAKVSNSMTQTKRAYSRQHAARSSLDTTA